MLPDYVDSHYSRTLADSTRWPNLDESISADVCVIGGGLAGLNTALGLAERGQSVVLLEAHRVGWGASGRNGGFVSPGFSLSIDALIAQVGAQPARELFDLTVDAMRLMQERIDRFAIDCGPIGAGTVMASWFDDEAALEKQVAYANDMLDAGLEFWPKAKLRESYASERYHGGIFNPRGLQLHPLNFTRGIAVAAGAAGVRIFEASAVQALDVAGDTKTITTEQGEVRADHVVVCCSGYINDLFQPLSRATLPVATYVMVTEPLGDRLHKVMGAPYGVADNRIAQDYYRPLADGRILWGGRVSCFKTPPRKLAEVMRGCMVHVYPQLADVRVEAAWDGLMGYARHRMPQIGQLKSGLWYCMGFGGRGMATTTMGGDLIASAIAKGDERYRLFDPFGLDYAGGPLRPAVAQTAYWFYQLRDWLKH